MGFPPGSVAAVREKDAPPIGRPDVLIMIYKARRISRVLIADPTAPRLNQAIYVIPSPAPMDWVDRLFAGKL